MARTEQSDLFVARILALAFAAFSAVVLFSRGSSPEITFVLTEVFAIVSVGIMASLRMRVGWRGTYRHPLTVLTILLLIPAFWVVLWLGISLILHQNS